MIVLRYTILTFFLIVLNQAKTFAQEGLLLYYMKNTPHVYQLNPASQPNYNVFVGLPVLSTTAINLRSSSITFSDFLIYNKELDAPVLPLYSSETKQNFLNKFSKVNDFSANFKSNLFSAGGKIDKFYLIFDASLVSNSRITYPGDFVEFLLNGNSGGAEISLDKFNFSSTTYLETGLVFSMQINDQFTIGVHPKYLNGLFTFYNRKNESNLFISAENAQLTIKNQYRIGLPRMKGLENYLTDSLLISDHPSDKITQTGLNSLPSIGPNWGLGLDLGVHYKPFPKLTTSLSITNLGFINWRGLNFNAQIDGSYNFEGLELNSKYMFGDDYGDNYLMSVLDSVNYSANNSYFVQALYPQFYLGGLFTVTPELEIGLVSATRLYRETVKEDLHFSLNFRANPNYSFSIGYNLNQKGKGNFSFGFGYKLLILNGYFITEGIPLQYDRVTIKSLNFRGIHPRILLPVNLYAMNFRFGLNLAFGNIDKPKKNKLDKM